jgi:DNA-binding transcriptional MocR family regulator
MDITSNERAYDDADTTTIELEQGAPDTSMIPFDLVHRACQEMFADDLGKQQRTYWTYADDEGNMLFREHIAEFLRQSCSIRTLTYANIFITNGVSAMLEQLSTMFLQANDTVVVECPTYMYALDIFRDHHVRLVSCETDDDGLILDSNFIVNVLERVKLKMIYLIPSFQNPVNNRRRVTCSN